MLACEGRGREVMEGGGGGVLELHGEAGCRGGGSRRRPAWGGWEKGGGNPRLPAWGGGVQGGGNRRRPARREGWERGGQPASACVGKVGEDRERRGGNPRLPAWGGGV